MIYQVNSGGGRDAEESRLMDFSHADAVNAAALNAVLWRDRKGAQPMPLARHRMVYATLGERMGGEIHALSLKTLTPEEAAAQKKA